VTVIAMITPTIVTWLIQWTMLLAVGWGLHASLREGHPRWRSALWKSILIGMIAIPFLSRVSLLPVYHIPTPAFLDTSSFQKNVVTETPSSTDHHDPAVRANHTAAAKYEVHGKSSDPTPASFIANPTSVAKEEVDVPSSSTSFTWARSLLVLWFVGASWALLRLVVLQNRLRVLLHRGHHAPPSLWTLVQQARRDLGLSRSLQIKISHEVSSPFLCGVFRPTVVIPQEMLETLTDAEFLALVRHELAHQRDHHLAWCLAWRLVRALLWFHPLVWNVPNAIRLCCEEEADRLAADYDYGDATYPSLLAALTLKAVPAAQPDLPLTLRATSQIVHRLLRLKCTHPNWTARHSLILGSLILPCVLLTTGWQFAPPLSGSEDQLQSKEHPTISSREAKAGDLTQTPAQPTHIPLSIRAYVGVDRRPVQHVSPMLLNETTYIPTKDWMRNADGSLSWNGLNRGKYFLHLTGQLPSGELVFSDGYVFFGEQRDQHALEIELKPGVRVEGHIDARVPRPIKNGWVQLSVHDTRANTRTHTVPTLQHLGNTAFWWTYRPIRPDGTFTFDAVPEGTLKVIAYGDGFTSSSGSYEPPSLPARHPRQDWPFSGKYAPQTFATLSPVTVIEIDTQSTATPNEAAVGENKLRPRTSPRAASNVLQLQLNALVFRTPPPSSESPFLRLEPLPTR